MDSRRIVSLSGLLTFAVLMVIVSLFSILAFSPANLPASSPPYDEEAKINKSFSDTPNAPIAFDAKKQKLQQ